MDGYRTLKAGQAVQFDTKPSDKGTHAINIRALDSDSLATADNEGSDERTLSAEGA